MLGTGFGACGFGSWASGGASRRELARIGGRLTNDTVSESTGIASGWVSERTGAVITGGDSGAGSVREAVGRGAGAAARGWGAGGAVRG